MSVRPSVLVFAFLFSIVFVHVCPCLLRLMLVSSNMIHVSYVGHLVDKNLYSPKLLLLFSSAIKTDFSCNNSITHIFEFINITIMKLFAVWAQMYRMKSYAMNEWLYEWCPCCMNVCRHKYLKCVWYTMEQKKRGQCGNKSNLRYKCFKIITRVQPTFLPSFWCLLFVLNSILC